MRSKHKRGRQEIARDGRIVAQRRRQASIDALQRAMELIEADTEKHGGIYPLNGGRITVQEVLRRAGKSSAFLEKASNHALKEVVKSWIAQANGKIVRGADNIRREITSRLNKADDEVKKIMQAWTEAELEYVKARNTIEQLQKDKAALLLQVSGGSVTRPNPGQENEP